MRVNNIYFVLDCCWVKIGLWVIVITILLNFWCFSKLRKMFGKLIMTVIVTCSLKCFCTVCKTLNINLIQYSLYRQKHTELYSGQLWFICDCRCWNMCITTFDQIFLTLFYNVVKLVSYLSVAGLCGVPVKHHAGVKGAHHSKVASFFCLKSPLSQMWVLSNYPFYHFGLVSKNNMDSL